MFVLRNICQWGKKNKLVFPLNYIYFSYTIPQSLVCKWAAWTFCVFYALKWLVSKCSQDFHFCHFINGRFTETVFIIYGSFSRELLCCPLLNYYNMLNTHSCFLPALWWVFDMSVIDKCVQLSTSHPSVSLSSWALILI